MDVCRIRIKDLVELDRGSALALHLRAFLDEAFGGPGSFSDCDWEHSLGGTHFVADDCGKIVGHVAVVDRAAWIDGLPTRVAYVEAMAVAVSYRRRGLASELMRRVEASLDTSARLGALSPSDEAHQLYLTRGWRPWRGALLVRSATAIRASDPSETVLVWAPAGQEPQWNAALEIDEREGDVW